MAITDRLSVNDKNTNLKDLGLSSIDIFCIIAKEDVCSKIEHIKEHKEKITACLALAKQSANGKSFNQLINGCLYSDFSDVSVEMLDEEISTIKSYISKQSMIENGYSFDLLTLYSNYEPTGFVDRAYFNNSYDDFGNILLSQGLMFDNMYKQVVSLDIYKYSYQLKRLSKNNSSLAKKRLFLISLALYKLSNKKEKYPYSVNSNIFADCSDVSIEELEDELYIIDDFKTYKDFQNRGYSLSMMNQYSSFKASSDEYFLFFWGSIPKINNIFKSDISKGNIESLATSGLFHDFINAAEDNQSLEVDDGDNRSIGNLLSLFIFEQQGYDKSRIFSIYNRTPINFSFAVA